MGNGNNSKNFDNLVQHKIERITEEKVRELLIDIGITPTELDTLVPPKFNSTPMIIDIRDIIFKTMITSKNKQRDLL